MKRYTSLLYTSCGIMAWLFLLIMVYGKGKQPAALIYQKIPVETVQFLDSISNRLDLMLRYEPDIRQRDWENKNNYGENPLSGFEKTEDKNFIVYHKKDDQIKVGKILGWANEGIPKLADLMGKYPYPADLYKRKLPIYLADTDEEFVKLSIKFGSSPNKNFEHILGTYYSEYSQMGNLTIGILLSPKIWKTDLLAQEVLWHEMNHYGYFTLIEYDKAIRPYIWVYEGLAEYFSQSRILQLTTDQIRQCSEYTLSATFPDYSSNYWGGESVYCFMEEHYGKEFVKAFIQHTYSNTIAQASVFAFGKELKQLEEEWKRWLQCDI